MAPEQGGQRYGALIGGPEPGRARIVDYDDAWPARYAAVRAALVAALGSRAKSIEHIGSTAVPGLAAKPVIDVVVTVADADDEGSYGAAVVAAGFQLRVRDNGHRMFRTPACDVHVHVYSDGAPEVGHYLDLRDRLRADAEDRAVYEKVKRSLAGRDWADMNDYADAKSEVIAEILARARP